MPKGELNTMKAHDTKNTLPLAGLSISEQETVITIDRETRRARIYTSDTRYINKLDKRYERKREHINDGKIAAVEYEVPEKLVSFRSKISKPNFSEEHRKALAERAKKLKA